MSFTVRDYVKSFKAYPGLEDKLSHQTFVLENNINESLFPPHLTPQQIHDGIKAGNFLQGTYYASRENFLEGSVNVEGHEKFVNYFNFNSIIFYEQFNV